MRLSRLDLTRYGHFTGTSFDFGPARDVDVTVVYGDNEAGKSTAFAAWLDLLFGIPPRNPPFAFLHPRAQLEIGARLETGTGTMELRRTGRGLSDGDGHALEETRIAALLHNLDRETYRMRFSLDDETLRRGGAEIASAKGDLGQALHVGTSGVAGVGAALDALSAEADAFQRKGGSTQVLARGKAELRELTATLKQSELSPHRWDRLEAAVGEARDASDAAGQAVHAARNQVTLCERARELRDLVRQEEEIAARLSDLPDGPNLAPGAETRARTALEALAAADEDRGVHRTTRDAAATELAAMPETLGARALIADVARIEALTLPDGSLLVQRVATARADLPNRTRDLATLAAARDAALAGAGLDDLAGVDGDFPDRLDAALSRAEAAWREHDATRRRLERERAELPRTRADTSGRAALAAALEALPDAAHLEELRIAADAARQAASDASSILPRDWQGLLPDLPEAKTIDAAIAMLAEREADLAAARRRAEDCAATLGDVQARAPAGGAAPVSDADLRAARAARDLAWDHHRAALDAESADAFAAEMRRHDDHVARHAGEVGARAAEAARQDRLREVERSATQADAALSTATAARDAARNVATGLAVRVGLSPEDAPAAIPARLRRLIEADRAERQATGAEARRDRLADMMAARLAELRRCLTQAGWAETDPPDPVAAARAHLEVLAAAERTTALRRAAEARIAEIEGQLAEAETDARMADHALEEILAGTGLAGRPRPDLRATVAATRQAIERGARHDELALRIDGMKAALERLEQEVGGLRETQSGGDAVEILHRAKAAAMEAERRARNRAQIVERHRVAEEAMARADVRDRAAQSTLDEVLKDQGGEGSVAERLDRIAARDELRRECRGVGRRMDDLRHGLDVAALEAERAIEDPARLDTLRQDLATREADHAAALEALGRARQTRDAAVTATGAQAARQARAALLETLRAGAREAASLRLGVAAARRALIRHQEKSRGRMLDATQEAFAQLTRGAWMRLETGMGEKGEALFAEGADGRKRIDAMSTGTQGQLYLALRIAGHAAFADAFGPLPFVLDDVAETFDDARAAAALDMLGRIGTRGQAILLTHHRHLVAMAREAIPDVRVMDLPARARAAS
ncbi:AAA family ATPase [Jannaschia sp. S6380]|uniref:AAA family ATPase n=1 Tax=Jannaschia sp. S6380 TaxID=2926408 RepID=UPI001FF0F45C|nr:AAA family ATPase [Jannaschia sp. S6380]MCK0168437.1 AAA family ATPase [Jannaschia sp. S6380]